VIAGKQLLTPATVVNAQAGQQLLFSAGPNGSSYYFYNPEKQTIGIADPDGIVRHKLIYVH